MNWKYLENLQKSLKMPRNIQGTLESNIGKIDSDMDWLFFYIFVKGVCVTKRLDSCLYIYPVLRKARNIWKLTAEPPPPPKKKNKKKRNKWESTQTFDHLYQSKCILMFSISRFVSHIPFGESQTPIAKPRKTKVGGIIQLIMNLLIILCLFRKLF